MERKVSSTPILKIFLFLLMTTNLKSCNSIEVSSTLADFHNDAEKLPWDHSNNEITVTKFENYQISEEVKTLNNDTLSILSDISGKQPLKMNLKLLEHKIGEIEFYFNDIVHYYLIYQNVTSTARMIDMCTSILQGGIYGPVKLINDIMDILLLGPLNIFDELKKQSKVRTS